MRIVRTSLLAIAVFAAIPLTAQRAAPAKPDPAFLVEFGRAGAFTVGMTVDEAQAIAGIPNTKLTADYGEGMFGPQMEIRVSGLLKGPAIIASITDFPCGVPSFRGLGVRDPRYKTSHGIGVGSTLADIRTYQPSAKITNFGADGGPVVTDAEPGVTFAFRDAVRSVATARVTELWVTRGPNLRALQCPDYGEWPAVYQAVFDDLVSKHPAIFGAGHPPIVLIRDGVAMCDAGFKRPAGVGCLDRARTTAPFLTGKLAENFYGRNSGQAEVPMLDGASAVVAADALATLFPVESPRTVVTFSSPGFDHGRAVAYVSYTCGRFCGEGSLLLLELRDDKWKVASVQPLWVS